MNLLRAAAWLFAAQGGVYFLIGALAPFLMDRGIGGPILLFSRRGDSAYFGDDTEALMERDPALARYRTLLFLTVAGLLVALGVAVVASPGSPSAVANPGATGASSSSVGWRWCSGSP
jgi:hypothetical protein